MKILVTGAKGFVGKNLCTVLSNHQDIELFEYDLGNSPEDLDTALRTAQVIFHLAGVNRPEKLEEYQTGNEGFTAEICRKLKETGRKPKVILSSSIQAELDNAYGTSKLGAEEELRRFCEESGAEGVVFRLKNLFGKWCRPNYNSVTATFCNNIAHDLPIQISDPARELDLTYIDDVIEAFKAEITGPSRPGFRFAKPLVSYRTTLGELAGLIHSFRDHRSNLQLPDYSDRYVRALYATYLSYVEPEDSEYGLGIKTDPRGSLAEFIKSPRFGQIFVSHTKPGITRGNHYHHTKTEKFMVVQGEGIIRLRHIQSDRISEHRVRGEEYRVVDILPGYTHSIENAGEGDMVTLFWSDEVFDPERPDTFFEPVVKENREK